MTFTPGTHIYFRKEAPASADSSESWYGLLSGRIQWSNGALVAVETDSLAVGPDMESGRNSRFMLQYEDKRRKFVQQQMSFSGIIEPEHSHLHEHSHEHEQGHEDDDSVTAQDQEKSSSEDAAERIVVLFELLGEAMPAENRRCYRVRARAFGIDVSCAGEHCQLADISHTGFALVCDQEFECGGIVDVSIQFNDSLLEGPVRIQSVRKIGKSQFRYGVVCLSRETERACARLATSLQQQQLRRLAGHT
ncbi:MAG: PilZ domain-containing protein [Fuerstiella sp.]